MLAIKGYYDGTTIQPLEKIEAKPNQCVIITIMDEFVSRESIEGKKSLRGILAQYADPKKAEQEKGAWQRAAEEKYGNT